MEFIIFPKGSNSVQGSLLEAGLPIYLPTPLDALWGTDEKNLVRESKINWRERIYSPNGEKTALKLEELVTEKWLKHHYFGREGMSKNWEWGIGQERLPGGGFLWSNLGNKRGTGELEQKLDNTSRLHGPLRVRKDWDSCGRCVLSHLKGIYEPGLYCVLCHGARFLNQEKMRSDSHFHLEERQTEGDGQIDSSWETFVVTATVI